VILERSEENTEIAAVMGQAKEDPEIAEALSVQLVEAKDEADIAEAITTAKTDVQLKTLTDPVARKLV